MIFDSIENRGHYRGLGDIYRVLEYLAGLQEAPAGTVEISGRQLFCNPVRLTTKPVEDCVFEAHRRYIDVHFILSGREGIAVQQVGLLAPRENFNAEKDIGFYTGAPAGSLVLGPGDFMVCWPEDAHRVAQMDGAPGEVVKMVGKVAV